VQQIALRRSRRFLLPLLVASTLGIFLPAVGYDFLRVDDPVYVTENAQVLGGMSRAGVVWAFSTSTPSTRDSLGVRVSMIGSVVMIDQGRSVHCLRN
jgi:hypothetical protein